MMGVFHQQIQMIINGKDDSCLCPEGSMRNPKFLCDAVRPNKKGVSNETGYRRLLRTEIGDELLDVQYHIIQQGFRKLVKIQRSIKINGQSIANLSGADIQA